jgi:acylphosphatase
VQGVGFRYQTVQVAKAFEVSGCVRNLMDGRVNLQVEGMEDEVRAFVTEVQNDLSSYIKKSEIKSGAGPREYVGFSIATTDG